MILETKSSIYFFNSKVWTGALLFIEAFAKYKISSFYCEDGTNIEDRKRIEEIRRVSFHNTKVLEFGCGTGVSGISLLLQLPTSDSLCCRPSFIEFTDFDQSCLDLCSKNCKQNQIQDYKEGVIATFSIPPESYNMKKLSWVGDNNKGNDVKEVEGLYDTTIATDVIYDIGSIQPLLYTAYQATKKFFILAHVCRADITQYPDLSQIIRRIKETEKNDKNAKFYVDQTQHENDRILERIILYEAEKVGFLLYDIIRPKDIEKSYHHEEEQEGCSSASLYSEMQDSGAAIFVFKKRKHHSK